MHRLDPEWRILASSYSLIKAGFVAQQALRQLSLRGVRK